MKKRVTEKQLEGITVQDWMDEALCREVGGDLWTPDQTEGSKGAIHRAIKLCGKCPVQAACLEYALDRGEMHGVWGGTTPTQRKRLRRERRQIA